MAGWDGSLVEQQRFTGAAAIADGAVRAKTGSLTGVSALAGVLTDADGRQLVFAFVADQAPSEAGTRTAIDDLAAALVALRLPLTRALKRSCAHRTDADRGCRCRPPVA